MKTLALIVSTALLLLAAGCGELEDGVLARNLTTGETQYFAKGSVPDGWSACPDPACSIPKSVPCQKLGKKVCSQRKDCRIKTLWCTGSGTTPSKPGGAPGGPGGILPDKCKYQCIPKLPLLCDELKAKNACVSRPDCQWAKGPCPALACAPGTKCPPCPSSCRKKSKPICKALGKNQCAARPDCQWNAGPCPACYPPTGPCKCKPGSCGPKAPPPPPCPTLPPPPPGFCKGGKVEAKYDGNGCVVGYACKQKPSLKVCTALDQAYVAAVQAARACDPFIQTLVPQCSKAVDSGLMCRCTTYVNPSNSGAIKTMQYLEKQWSVEGCDKLGIACATLWCPSPKGAGCKPDSSTPGVVGRCKDATSKP